MKDYSFRQILEKSVDWKKKMFHELSFFEFVFKKYKISSVLDIRSGSGNTLCSLHSLINYGLGIDTDPVLISSAQDISELYPHINFINSGLQNIRSEISRASLPRVFDAALLLNNQLPTTINENNIINSLKLLRELIAPNGIVILSVFNYNKIMKDQDYEFGKHTFSIDGNVLTLSRYMKILDTDLISYSATVYDSSGKEVKSHQELHNPLTKGRLNFLLSEAGFSILDIFGDMSFREFNVDKSKKIVILAKPIQKSP